MPTIDTYGAEGSGLLIRAYELCERDVIDGDGKPGTAVLIGFNIAKLGEPKVKEVFQWFSIADAVDILDGLARAICIARDDRIESGFGADGWGEPKC